MLECVIYYSCLKETRFIPDISDLSGEQGRRHPRPSVSMPCMSRMTRSCAPMSASPRTLQTRTAIGSRSSGVRCPAKTASLYSSVRNAERSVACRCGSTQVASMLKCQSRDSLNALLLVKDLRNLRAQSNVRGAHEQSSDPTKFVSGVLGAGLQG